MSTTTTHHQPVVSYRAQFARRLTREKLFREFTALSRRAPGGDPGRSFLGAPGSGGFRPPTSPFDLPREDEIPHDTRPPPPGKRFRAAPGAQEPKFCIVGAGVAGLFLAMILSELKIPYDLLESSDRVGGRMYTKHFSDIHPDSSKQFPNVDAKHDYYDIGAMRYPKIPLMDKYVVSVDPESVIS